MTRKSLVLGKKANGLGFFIPMVVFIIFGGFFLQNIGKGDLVLFLNRYHTSLWDSFFRYFTLLGEAGVYLIGLLFFLFVAYRKSISFLLLGMIVSGVSYFTKIYFHHPRPLLFFTRLHIIDTISLVPGVVLHGGNSSFPSGHTMSAFAIYTLFACYSKNIGVQFLFFVVAFLVGFSRMYLVQHFFEDVYLGAIMGTFIGWMVYRLQGVLSFGSGKLSRRL